MQDVSAEWIENQNLHTRKQGFVTLEIDKPDGGVITISSLDSTGLRLKKTIHSRSFDPMAFISPQNDLTIELYNYDGEYDDFYKTYNYQSLKVVMRYGFCLTENETINGGTFYIEDISLKDKIITIEATSGFYIKKDMIYYPLNNQFEIYNGTDGGIEYKVSAGESGFRWHFKLEESDISETFEIRTDELFENMKTALGINIVNETGEIKRITTVEYGKFKIGEVLISVAEGLGYKPTINREDTIVLNNYGTEPLTQIKQTDMLVTPVYTRTKTVNKFTVNSINQKNGITNNFTKSDCEVKSVDGSSWGLETAYEWSVKIQDLSKYSIEWIDVYSNFVNYGEATQSYPGRIYNVMRDNSTETVTMVIKKSGGPQSCIKIGLIDNKNETVSITEVSKEGLECDICNKILPPETLKKVQTYFSNRDTYELSIRGNPAVDVGDYIWVSLTDDNDFTTYKKALVLESELIFDGSFKDNMKVRIIDTDFEEIKGNTHEELANKTHEQLSAYTHKQLMTEEVN